MARLSASTVRQPMRRRRNTRSCSTASSTRRRRVDGTRPPFCRSGKRLAGRERALCFLSPVGRVTASSPFRSRAPSVPSAEVPRRRPADRTSRRRVALRASIRRNQLIIGFELVKIWSTFNTGEGCPL
jgi:hypothetical protein